MADPTNAPARARNGAKLPAAVFTLGWISFCNDTASELIVPLLPGFMLALGASRVDIGLLQGISDLVLAALKLASGRMSDHQRRRKPWMLSGYGISCAVRPLLSLVAMPWQATLVRSCDRVGKGLRSAPRDALLVDAVDASQRGAAFGVQRAMDHGGALTGSLLAAALLWLGLGDRTIFALAAVPGVIVIVLLVLAVREIPHVEPGAVAKVQAADGTRLSPLLPFLLVVVLGAFGTGIDLFLIARAIDLGVPRMQLPLLCAVLHVVRAGLSAPFGSWSDRLGRRKVIAFGLASHAVVMVGFGYVAEAIWLWPLFALHGLHAAFTEGAERGFVADLTGAGRRGTVFGVYHAVQGLAAFGAPLFLGAVWDARGPIWAFGLGAGSQLLALLLLLTVVPSSRRR